MQPILDPDGVIFGARRSAVAWALWSTRYIRVEIASDVPGMDECWLSTRADRGVGYPCIKVGKKVVDVHRVAFLLANGDLPKGALARHRCDVRRCCRPSHLIKGTHQQNHDDMVARGRRVGDLVTAANGVATHLWSIDQ